MSDLSLIDAKLRYIKTWQALPEYGITYFVVRIKGSKYKEVKKTKRFYKKIFKIT